MKIHTLTFLCLLLSASSLKAETYRVGPERALKSLKEVVARLKAGDVVEIDGGTYREAMKISAQGTPEKPIVIRGVGKERPLFDGEGLNLSGVGAIPRGILQIEGSYIVLEHLAFKNGRNGENAAGIRLLDSTNAVIRDCHISYCDMGIFGGDRETATIENCEVAWNGTEKFNGYSHNLYMSGNRVLLRGCYIHDSLFGQNYKSRAHFNELRYNWIADGAEGEIGTVDSDETATPHSNTLLVGNVVVSSPKRTGNTSKFVLFGSEMGKSHDGMLYAFHNTFVAGDDRIQFVTLSDPKAGAVLSHNIFVGSPQIFNAAQPPLSIAGSHNWIPNGATAPDTWQSTLSSNQPGFVDSSQRDFRLRVDSPLLHAAARDLSYVDGDGKTQQLKVESTLVSPLTLRARPAAQLSIGALDN